MRLTHHDSRLERNSRSQSAAREALIPSEWRIPSTDALSVLDIPRTCGILSPKEIEITETDGTILVQKMIKGELEVTEAFWKRAAIGQQLVCPIPSPSVQLKGLKLTI